MPTFGDNLKALRKSRGYSQERFAQILGSNQVNISAWEIGTRMPNLTTIQHIANTFNVPVASLIPHDEKMEDEAYVREVADMLRSDPKIRMLFDRAKYMSSADLDTVLSVINAITRERAMND